MAQPFTLADLNLYTGKDAIAASDAGQKARTLADLGRYAAQGDYAGAAGAAFAGGEPDIGAAMAKMGAEKHQQIVQDAASLAFSADTPEKWAAAGQQFTQAHPEIAWAPFQARSTVISQAQSVAEKMAQANADRSFGLQQQVASQKDTPSGFQTGPNGSLAPIPGGPADPAYLKSANDAKGMGNIFDGTAGDNIANPAAVAMVSDAAFQPPGTRNEDFLKQLPPEAQGLVKGLANYELDISKISSVRGNQRLMLAAAAKQYDPTFDMTQYGARAAMRKSITSGTYSQALNSANLVIQHLDALSKSVDGLHNTGLKPWNAVSNIGKEQTGDPAITKFNTARDAAAAELAKVFKGTGASDVQSIQEWRNNLDINGSPEQIRQSIATAVGDLLKSRIDTIQNQFQAAMGHPADFSYLTPHSRQVLTDLGIDPSALDPGFKPTDQAPPDQGGQGGGWTVEPVQ